MRVLTAFLIASAAWVSGLSAQQPGGSIDLPAGVREVLQVKGVGTQNYTCTDTHDGLKWVLTGPSAKLMDAAGKTIGSHFAGPTWKLDDGGQVQGKLMASKPAPGPGSVAWLLLSAQAGTATGSLAGVAYIRRAETVGGVAPAGTCEVGKTTQVDYSATYTFYAEK
jgi:hypothetical protein